MNVTFDWNEWFSILSSIGAILIFWPIRSYFSTVLLIVIFTYNLALVATIDYFLIATPFHLYYFGDNTSYEASGALFHFFMYPASSILFLFIYDKWKLYRLKTVWYILCWTAFSLFFEWLCVINHVLTYTGWKLPYSIPVYPAAAMMLLLVYHFAARHLHELSLRKLAKNRVIKPKPS
ncbi:hypothetical protein [Paenibacillus cremeus]|uniref:Uncharacterized protein n=1 Tax=Paenibacillus cremeus TaxID=2163881 RepID=A0A559KF57_9BACL|nr:hypothetical protein [Paenibacillus cremeus]TVY10750.1 hypothetical protein FPZ49_06515 [Paenibacillus cremeus]